jgi:hypothetical protein
MLSVIALVTRRHIDHRDALRSYVMKLVLSVLRQSHNIPQTSTMFPSLADTSFCFSIIQLTLYKTQTSLHGEQSHMTLLRLICLHCGGVLVRWSVSASTSVNSQTFTSYWLRHTPPVLTFWQQNLAFKF